MACPSSSHSRWENWDLNPDRFHCLYHDTKIQKLQTRGLSQIWLTDIFCLAHIVFKKKQTWICCQCFKIENLHIKKQNLFFPTSLAKNQKTGNAGPVFPPERDWPELTARSQLGRAPQSPSLAVVFPKPRLSILCEGHPAFAVLFMLFILYLRGLGRPLSSLPHSLWKCPSQLLTPVVFGLWGAGSPSWI